MGERNKTWENSNSEIIMKKIINYINPKLIAVTGGMGSGQSTVCDYLKSLGCKIINLDVKAKQIIQTDLNLQKELKKTFGRKIFDAKNRLDNKTLAAIAFSDETKTMKLNKLVHPRMISEVIEEMESARFSRKFPLIVIDAALIYEINMEQMFDIVIVVDTDLETRIKRIMERDGLTRSEIMNRINRQIPLDEKKEWADYVINNNVSLEELKKQTRKIYEKLVEDILSEKRIRV
jgi:dephospho-CoA kinase